MTLIYHFTDGSTADSVSGAGPFTDTPWDTAVTDITAVARPTTRQGRFDAIDAALVAAGWTKHVTTAGSDHVYFSDGENGDQHLCIRIELQSSDRYTLFYCGTKLASGAPPTLDSDAIGGDTALQRDRWDTSSDITTDLQILASKDFIWAVSQNINHTGNMDVAFLGAMKATSSNPNVLASGVAVTAGDYVVVATGTNPLDLGYRVGDFVQLVEVDQGSSPFVETQQIVAVTTTTITLKTVINTYTSARIGTHIVSVGRWVSQNDEFDSTTHFSSPVLFDTPSKAAGDLCASNGFPSGDVASYTKQFALGTSHNDGGGAFGSGTQPNFRTNRFTCRAVQLKNAPGDAVNASFAGALPGLLTYNGSVTYYPHDDMEDRQVISGRYSPFRFTATSTEHYLLGPVPQ